MNARLKDILIWVVIILTTLAVWFGQFPIAKGGP